ncbi:MAG: hypothetical protein R3E82_13780 [Pseudomonadales bacterium]|nr:hypothetical protein [Pseudomonadales bacterium]
MNARQRLLLVLALCLTPIGLAAETQTPADGATDAQLLRRIYELRMRFEQERAMAENEARANVRLVTQSGAAPVDSPTVSGLRAQTSVQLSRFEQQFRCLDVDVAPESGNTVVICGDNTGDISGSNVSAQRDIVTVQGANP